MNADQTAFIFPGQGSQTVGMGSDLAREFPAAEHIFTAADELLGFSLSSLAWEGPDDGLNDTINTQPALLVHSVAVLTVFQELHRGFQPMFVAGHSMGELSALVAAGALTYLDALRLVRKRGELMKQAGEISPGGMAAVLGLDIQTLESICIQASRSNEIVQVANDNCPGQVVISGDSAALERAIELAKSAGARRARSLAVSIAAHSPLMTTSQDAFNQAVRAAPIQDPVIPLIGNVTAAPLETADQIRADLQAQLTSRVRWTETIQRMTKQGVTTFIELGNGSVLTGLIKRIDPEATCIAIGNPQDFDKIS